MPSGSITTSAPPSPSIASSAITCGVRRPARGHRLLLHRIGVHLGGEVVDAVLLAHDLHAEHDREHDRGGREQRADSPATARARP